MKSEIALHKPASHWKPLLTLCCLAVWLVPALSGAHSVAQSAPPAAAPAHKIDDTWQGTLHAGQKDLRIVAKITRTDAGGIQAVMYSIDQGGQGIPASSASFADGVLKFAIDAIDGAYEGRLSADGKSIAGTWKQGPNPLALLFERATPETEWTIPAPPAKVPPMAADADPSFEVATIKPSQPDRPGKAFLVRGTKFLTVNTTLNDLITFAYGVQQKQVVGQPSWVDSDKWDIEAQPDVPGSPNDKQLKIMVRKLLTDRFQFAFHKDSKELSAYLLTVSKTGNKMTVGSTDPNQLPGLFFRGLGILSVQNATMTDFTQLMQTAVLDKPVVDQTSLPGKWNFLLKWTPDESQFGGMGIKIPPPSDAADAPPPLFTAIQEQIGLKLEAGKAQVPVLVIDKAEKPSAN